MPNDATASSEEKPNHMIVLLDLNMGMPGEYQHLKASFSTVTDPQHELPVQLVDRDYDELLRTADSKSINFEGVKFSLASFTNAERCVEFLKASSNKRIFLITSGRAGRAVLPLIDLNCKKVFTDPVTNVLYSPIYVFCHDIERQRDWILDYLDYIQPPFTFDADLLARMIRDIADYFVLASERLLEVNPPKYSAAHNHLNWAHELYQRYSKLESDPLTKEFKKVNTLLERVENVMKSSSDNED
jgi:hypothetical protein